MNTLNRYELTLENMGQWPLAVKIRMLIGFGVFILFLGYWLIIQDNLMRLSQLKAREVNLKASFEKKQRQLYDLPSYRKQLNVLNERFALMLKQLPAKNKMPGLLEEISRIGLSSGLKFKLFVPQPELMHDFYVELPIKISVVGTYFQCAAFISRIAEINRIVTLHALTIERGASESGDQWTMNLSAKIYRYRRPC